MIKDNEFNGNTAQQGGAIAFITADYALVEANNFYLNSARMIIPSTVKSAMLPANKAQGGAIYSLCLEAYGMDCRIQLRLNKFTANTAEN